MPLLSLVVESSFCSGELFIIGQMPFCQTVLLVTKALSEAL